MCTQAGDEPFSCRAGPVDGIWPPAVITLALALLTGCTILNPMSLSDTDRRFALPGPKAAGTAEASDAGAACRPGAADGACEPRPAQLDHYVGTLAQAMWELDLARRALTRDALERSRLNSSFNALTWPAVAFAAAKRLRDPGWSPRDAVALGFAAYHLLGEDVPERDRVYLQTANRLACSLMVSEAYLYEKTPPVADAPEGFGLRRHANALRLALKSHERHRATVVPQLKLAPGKTPPEARHPVHALRLQAIGKAPGAVGTSDPATPFLDALGQTEVASRATYSLALQVEEDVLDAGTRLRHQHSRIKSAMFAELQNRAPAPSDPLAAARQMVAALDSAVARKTEADQQATAAGKAQSRKAADNATWEPTPARLKGFSEDAIKAVTVFWWEQEIPLRQARRDTQDWLDAHQRRVAAYRKEARNLGCGDDDFAAFITQLAVRVAVPAPAASSSGAGSGGESGLPASGSSKP